MALVGHTGGFTSGTLLGVPVLFCLILVRALTGVSVHHDTRQDRVERHDWETTPAHGANVGQGHDVELSLLTSTGSVGPCEGKEGPSDPRGLLLLLILLFSLHCNPCFPLAYKRESRTSHKGHRNTSHQLSLESIEP